MVVVYLVVCGVCVGGGGWGGVGGVVCSCVSMWVYAHCSGSF